MQNAKDSFYMALRNRLAVLNPERTILLRGAVRPGILVEEAEAPFNQLPGDVFVLRWEAMGADKLLVKPTQTRVLLQQIEKLLASHEAKLSIWSSPAPKAEAGVKVARPAKKAAAKKAAKKKAAKKAAAKRVVGKAAKKR